ncbi:AAA family ATPase [Coleofasciculus sp. FACHB-129]|uniref:ATP-binding protein n=1 Tax=Cyanophyceae TaxID=3028117 RepID=UPI001684AD2C|nr:AAA family ATPase [Coleofasciculus sp. FACHB-129]MBD1897795.1 AAA family ATPase [Coleofasciculus sp. FACHB-129]
MHLLRIQVPDFRVLKAVDITFENEFVPTVFPLGSQNGGGKSTLLQLIFVLLHCSGESNKKVFLKNMLYGFKSNNDSNQKILAIIDIFHNNKVIQLKFFCNKNSYFDNISNLNNRDKAYDDELPKFSASKKLDSINKDITRLHKEIHILERDINRLKILKGIKNHDERLFRLRELIEEIKESNMRYYKMISPVRSRQSVEEFQEELQGILDVCNLNLDRFFKEREEVERIIQRVMKYLQSENLIYICNYYANENKGEEEVLLCQVNNIEMTEVESFLKELSQKVFLAAPATQVFLFLSQESRKLLFKDKNSGNDYYSQLEAAKSKLTGFFTYDFLAVDILIASFKAARDKDFREAIETGNYGNSYKTLVSDLNLILSNKKINLDTNLSGVTFKVDRDGEDMELYPEDLSHGELKRLSIYMWIKYYNIGNAIVLMDEIEIAFHPDWQYQIIADLKQWSPTNQYILATHSYELCQAVTPAHVKELEPKLLKQEA